jgi:hypothetical protein
MLAETNVYQVDNSEGRFCDQRLPIRPNFKPLGATVDRTWNPLWRRALRDGRETVEAIRVRSMRSRTGRSLHNALNSNFASHAEIPTS